MKNFYINRDNGNIVGFFARPQKDCKRDETVGHQFFEG